jgi:hypothetical protein
MADNSGATKGGQMTRYRQCRPWRFQCGPDAYRLPEKSLEGADATAGAYRRPRKRGGMAGRRPRTAGPADASNRRADVRCGARSSRASPGTVGPMAATSVSTTAGQLRTRSQPVWWQKWADMSCGWIVRGTLRLDRSRCQNPLCHTFFLRIRHTIDQVPLMPERIARSALWKCTISDTSWRSARR